MISPGENSVRDAVTEVVLHVQMLQDSNHYCSARKQKIGRRKLTEVLTNCAGPPAGKLVNWFLESEMCVRFSSELRRPSGKLEMRLFSTLNCSSAVQLAREPGMESDCGQELSQYLAVLWQISQEN